MASFNELKKKLEENSSLKSLDPPVEAISEAPSNDKEITGYSLEECIQKAENLFQIPQSRLAYEIIEKGSKGVLGVGKKLYKVLFSIAPESETIDDIPLAPIGKGKEIPRNAPVDGDMKFVVKRDGIFIKIIGPKNGGQPIDFNDALTKIMNKGVKSYDGREIKKIVQEASGKWVKIGEYIPKPEYDSSAEIEISSDEMKAYLTVKAPILTGRNLEESEILELLETKNIVFGINNDKIKEVLEEEHFNVPILIAEGLAPKDGKNAEINFHFKTDTDSVHFEEDESGRVDFYSDLGLIQNVVAGQILAVKSVPENGTPGKTLTGKVTEAKDGEEIPFEAGKNTTKSDNGLEIIAQSAGRAVCNEGVIEVEPMFEVKGDVGLKTGSVVFLGDVMITGSVEDGFSVKAAGNIHIGGTIGNAEVEADGDIVVQRGILCKGEGTVKAGGSIFAKFIENSKVSAVGKVVANEGILHSVVDARQVFCLGKRGTITGGHVRTVEEVNAKTIGSTTYTETKIEAGIDPIAKEKLEKFLRERDTIEENLSKLSVNLTTMQSQKRSLGQLSPERELMLERMLRAKKEFDNQLKEINIDIEELKSYLSSMTSHGKVSGNDKIYPGTEITIKNTTLKIKSEFTHVTFALESGEIKPIPYQEPKGLKEDKKKATTKGGGRR
ncbi:MAG: FapA family protein [Spirochaetota bacterium]|nr:FapA family protein [Spirochaetota bacterium]